MVYLSVVFHVQYIEMTYFLSQCVTTLRPVILSRACVSDAFNNMSIEPGLPNERPACSLTSSFKASSSEIARQASNTSVACQDYCTCKSQVSHTITKDSRYQQSSECSLSQ